MLVTKTRKRRTGAERREYREELMNIAADTLLELGLRDTKMDEIAERTGQSKVVLYRHFASKDDLIHQILEREAERLLEIDRRPYHGGAKRAGELLTAARENISSFTLLVRDARDDTVYGEHFARVRHTIFERLASAFEERGVEKRFADLSANAIANLVLDATLFWIENGSEKEDKRFIEWYDRAVQSLDRGWRDLLTEEGRAVL